MNKEEKAKKIRKLSDTELENISGGEGESGEALNIICLLNGVKCDVCGETIYGTSGARPCIKLGCWGIMYDF